MQVLIVKTSSMGDIIHTLPALTDAQRAIPTIKFDWVVEEAFTEIPAWHPAVNKIIPVALRRWRKNWFSQQNKKERNIFINELQKQKYDLIIDAQALIKSAFFVCSKARGICHGYDIKSVREFPACLFYNKRHFVAKYMHAIERIRILFAKSLNYQNQNIIGEYNISHNFSFHNYQDKQYLYFAHSTTAENKHWNENHWSVLIDKINYLGYKIKLPWGNKQEYERSLRLARNKEHVEVLPKLSLKEQAEVIKSSKLVVSVDTGLSHLTAALNHPNVTLYGPTDINLIGTYGKNQQKLTGENKDINNIKPDDVLISIKKVLNDLY